MSLIHSKAELSLTDPASIAALAIAGNLITLKSTCFTPISHPVLLTSSIMKSQRACRTTKSRLYDHLDLFFSTNAFQEIGFSSSIPKLSERSAPA